MLAMAVTLAAAKSRFAHATSPAHFSLIALVNNAAETIGRKSPLAAKFGAFELPFVRRERCRCLCCSLAQYFLEGHQELYSILEGMACLQPEWIAQGT